MYVCMDVCVICMIGRWQGHLNSFASKYFFNLLKDKSDEDLLWNVWIVDRNHLLHLCSDGLLIMALMTNPFHPASSPVQDVWYHVNNADLPTHSHHQPHFKCCMLSSYAESLMIDTATTLYRWKRCNSLVQVIYIVQPSSLTHSLMFVFLSLFHLILIKSLFRPNWTIPSCQWRLPVLMLQCPTVRENRKSTTAEGFYVTKCCIREFWYNGYQSLLIPLLVSSFFF